MTFQMAWCRKIFASYLRQCGGIEGETADLLQGRKSIGVSIDARHYLVPRISLKDDVLNALNRLRRDRAVNVPID